ncbi:MAG TPA: amino acid adenylation domain-containing protein [Vicinamibacterales bacterium]
MSERHELPEGTHPALRARFDRLSAGDQARVLARLAAGNWGREGSFHIPRRNERRAPLTFAQQGVWFRQQLAPESPVWNLSRTWTVNGPLDVTALERALSEMIRRHESLRTRYLVVNGEPAQEVMPATPVAIELLDARESANDVRQTASDFRGELATRPFDLASPVMIRAGIASLGPERYELTLVRHHICSDQWSSGLFRRELSTVYDDFVSGRESSLPDLRLQFNDYAWWASDAAKGEAAAAALAEAVETLKGMPDASSLVASPDRHAPASGPGGRVTGAIPAPVVRALRTLAQSHEATLFMALMAIFNALVHRSTHQTDVVVVTPVAGREHPELESLIGLFANVLPLRTDVSGDPSFLDLLARVQRGTTRLFAHQHVPIQRLQAELRPGWTGARLAMSSLLFALQNVPHDDLRLTGADARTIASGPHPVFEDLSLFASENADGALVLRADYRADRLDEPDIRRAVDDFAAIATHVVDKPATRLSDLPTRAPRATICRPAEWNDTPATYPRDACVQELVERQVERTPDADAAVDGATRVSYRELNIRANRLAHYLRTRGAAPETVVGLSLGRSVDLVIALLGILKSGAAYVPLDASFPAERLRFVLSETAAVLCVTSSAFAHRFADPPVPLVQVDADRAAIDAMSADNPTRTGTADDLAYVMYTSGSTGQPKGVEMPHRPLVNLLSWHARHPRLMTPARTLQFAPVSFDVSFQDIVATWCTGGTVVMIGDDTRRDPAALLRFVEQHAIERLYLPAAALKLLGQAHAASPRPLVRLRDIIAAGEALHVTPDIRRLAAGAPGCHLHNHYGPTEAHVVTVHELDGRPDTWPAAVPIGRPLSNVHIEILDDDRQRVDGETAGELHIGGDCLARGYRGRPDQTAERFVDDPFRAGLRLYRTGDRARWRLDGTLEFLGRLDDQVKLSGYRVEPGEIEAVMAECPGVSQAAVLLREDRPDDKRLVGYYVASAGGAITPGALQARLRQRLPRYMLPAALVELTALPLTATGKVDRSALPRPPTDRTAREAPAPPSDAIEASLVALWSDVLDRTGIGVDDNFFDLGGHSILAATMLLRAEQALGRAPGLNVLFERPTIRQFAHAFRGEASQPARMVLTWITDASGGDRGRPPLIVMPSMFGAVDEWRTFFRGIDVDRPIFGLELLSGASYWTDEPSMQEIAARCVEVLQRDLSSRRFHLIGHSFGGRLAYELGQQLDAAGQAPSSIVIADTATTGAPRRTRWRDLRSMAANAPGWLNNELRTYRAAALAHRIRNRWRFRMQAHERGLDGIFDLSRFPEGYRRRLVDSHRAFTTYRARPTRNRVVYLRSRVRSLIHSHRPDGGWGEIVPRLAIVPIPGDHGSVLYPQWREDVASAIREALEQVDRMPY